MKTPEVVQLPTPQSLNPRNLEASDSGFDSESKEASDEFIERESRTVKRLRSGDRITNPHEPIKRLLGLSDDHDKNSQQIAEREQSQHVWGYMISTLSQSESFLLSKESRCGLGICPSVGRQSDGMLLKDYSGDNLAASGYLIGTLEECDVILHGSEVAERHCLLFRQHKTRSVDYSDLLVYIQDISNSGTWVNGQKVEQNMIRLLKEGDLIELSEGSAKRGGRGWHYHPPLSVSPDSFQKRFKLGRKLGTGHFADVYIGQDNKNGKQFAVKILKKRLMNKEGLSLQEIGMLMSLTHPAITCIRDVFDEHDKLYLVLELAPKGELFDLIIKKGKLSEKETRRIYVQLLGALKYLHDRGIVHRDIKPENILLMNEDKLDIRLADFGLAKIIGDKSFTSTLAGTPSYIAPEILDQSRFREYNKQVDIWSAGVVLYICLCGFPPFSQELAPPSMQDQIKQGKFNFPSPYWDSVSDPALDLIERMLTVDPNERITITGAFEHEWILQHEMDVDDVAPAVYQKKGIKRQRTLIKDLGREEIIQNGLASPPR